MRESPLRAATAEATRQLQPAPVVAQPQQRNQLIKGLASKHLIHPLAMTRHRRHATSKALVAECNSKCFSGCASA